MRYAEDYNATTKVLGCSCANQYQDSVYGSHRRLHNAAQSKSAPWRCTSCGTGRSDQIARAAATTGPVKRPKFKKGSKGKKKAEAK